MINQSFIDIEAIQPKRDVARNEDLQSLSDSILAFGGLLTPLVVIRSGFQQYDLEFNERLFQAVRVAQRQDESLEMINAFVFEPDQREAAAAFLEQLQPGASPEPPVDPDERVATLVENLQGELRAQRANTQQIADAVARIDRRIETQPAAEDPLTAINTQSKSELRTRLAAANIAPGKTLDKITEALTDGRAHEPYESLGAVVERARIQQGRRQQRALSAEKMLDFVDMMNRVRFESRRS
jgi:hypothetical protein